MKHAGAEALDALEPLLDALRALEGLTEKKRGVFDRASRAFLHFHDDPDGYFADLRTGADFDRFRVTSRAEQRAFMQSVERLQCNANRSA